MAAVNKKNNTNICDELLAKYAPQQRLQIRKNISTSEKGIHYRAAVNPERERLYSWLMVVLSVVEIMRQIDPVAGSRTPSRSKFVDRTSHRTETWGCRARCKSASGNYSTQGYHVRTFLIEKEYARIVSTRMPSNSGICHLKSIGKNFEKTINVNSRR